MPFQVAKCPTCGASLELEKSSDVMICKFCGNKILFKESMDTDLNKTANFLKLANNEMEVGNFQKAIEYFNKVLENDPQNSAAHFGKGLAYSRESNVEDFKFKELLAGYSNAIKTISDSSKKEFLSSSTDLLFNHGMNCERKLHEKFIYGVTDKELDYYVERSFQIISFYQAIYQINENDLRPQKRIVELTKSLSLGVKGKGNRYDNNCNLIQDWRYDLNPEINERIKSIQNDCVKIIQKTEPEFVLVQEKKEIIKSEPKKKGFFGKFRI